MEGGSCVRFLLPCATSTWHGTWHREGVQCCTDGRSGVNSARPTAQPALQYGGGASTARGAWCTPGQLGFLSSPLHDFIQTDLFQAVALTASELTINSNVFRQLSAPREGMRSRI